MAVRNSVLTAMCVAALVGVASVGAVNAQTTLSNLTINVTGTSVTVTGVADTDGATVVSGINATNLGNLSLVSATNLIGFNGVFSGPLASFTINTPGSPFGGTLDFSTDAPVGFFAAASFSDTSPVTSVPEPGAVVFGVLATGSILGLLVRKRKA